MRRVSLYRLWQALAVLAVLVCTASCGGGGGGGGSVVTPSFTVSFVSGGNGTLVGSASQTVSQGGSAATVRAVPASGYHFVSWTEGGVVVGSDPALTPADVQAEHSYQANFAINTQVSFRLNLTGALPTGSAVSGAYCTLTLPDGVAPALSGGNPAPGVVLLSGGFAGSSIAPQLVYTPAAGASPGTLRVILATSQAAGVSQAGEVATVTLEIPTGGVYSEASFGVSAAGVVDVARSDQIAGMSVAVTNLVLQ